MEEKTQMSIVPAIGWTREWLGRFIIAVLVFGLGWAVNELQAKGKMEQSILMMEKVTVDLEQRMRVREAQASDIMVLKTKLDNLTEKIVALNEKLDRIK